MKNLLFLLLLLTSLTTKAQNFQFGLSLQPALTGNLVTNDGSVPRAVEDTYKGLESTTFGYSGCLFTQYALNPRAGMQIGAGYSKTGYVINRMKLIYAQPEPSAPESIVFTYLHHDIIIPILFKYNLNRRKNIFYVIGGPTSQIKLARVKSIKKKYADGEKTITKESDTITNYRTLDINTTIGIGYELQLSSKTCIFFQPTFDYNLLGTSKSAGLNRKIFSFGLNLGLVLE